MKFDTTPLSYSSIFLYLYGVWFWQTTVVATFLGENSFSAVYSGDMRWKLEQENGRPSIGKGKRCLQI
jgi:hypothetical protein